MPSEAQKHSGKGFLLKWVVPLMIGIIFGILLGGNIYLRVRNEIQSPDDWFYACVLLPVSLSILSTLVGKGTYACVKRKGFHPFMPWAIVGALFWPTLILLELWPRGVRSEKTSPGVIEYIGMGLAALIVLLIVLGCLSRL
ncbi:hypothetical protein E3E11_06540 [Oecophyllibacter saccharovorans]|uniref:hypothetical protein n=1 Tax=Oecophyllibacter saccharovorans TaxID=2558360 RepID=UPI001142458E|nr:hypothetical protein [Oecophyllibacter saccharovorans]QDH15562.1 hypothetical protein E3E11_06540 [Oecophyllibacter saccharovorans]